MESQELKTTWRQNLLRSSLELTPAAFDMIFYEFYYLTFIHSTNILSKLLDQNFSKTVQLKSLKY